MRELHNPDGIMRSVQYRISTRILTHFPIPDYIHAFERERSIPRMAHHHVGKDVVISIDIKDFFTSIKQARLATIFENHGIAKGPARTLSELCTYKAFVPQGGLTSPKISNIVAAVTFGPDIKEYCDREKLTLSIYADDITVSFTGTRPVSPILRELMQLISKHGFRVNTKKTKVMTKARRQYVCGVVVNEKPNLIREERQRLRAIVHNIVKNGLEAEAAKNQETPEKFAEIIRGKVNWFRQLNKPLGDRMMTKLSDYLFTWNQQRAQQGITTSAEVADPNGPQVCTLGSEEVEIELAPWEG